MTATAALGKYWGLEPDDSDDHPEYAEAAIGSVAAKWQPLHSVAHAGDSGLTPPGQ